MGTQVSYLFTMSITTSSLTCILDIVFLNLGYCNKFKLDLMRLGCVVLTCRTGTSFPSWKRDKSEMPTIQRIVNQRHVYPHCVSISWFCAGVLFEPLLHDAFLCTCRRFTLPLRVSIHSEAALIQLRELRVTILGFISVTRSLQAVLKRTCWISTSQHLLVVIAHHIPYLALDMIQMTKRSICEQEIDW